MTLDEEFAAAMDEPECTAEKPCATCSGGGEACEAAEDRQFEDMTDEQLTLYCARRGISPEDTRKSLARAMAMFEKTRAALKGAP